VEIDMAALVLDGRQLARTLAERLAERVKALAERRAGGPPTLAIILVGADPSYVSNARMKSSACRSVGMQALQIDCPPEATTADVLAEIDRLNGDPRVHGIFLQHPLPGQVDERRCFDRIAIEKDVGGDSSLSFGRLALGESAFGAATPAAIMRLLSCYGIALEGQEAVVVGRSPMVGKPMAMMLLGANATVTICHSRTRDLPEVIHRAGIVVGAVGRRELIKGEWIGDGAVVIDAGFHAGGAGDVELAAVVDRCSAYTPVPGGVGPMTIATLLEHTLEAAERAAGV
jgi:methylenetetrahydrofolate dehydrogenase (NADP+)/methenyltetrahydrofolate cyclohydrolase